MDSVVEHGYGRFGHGSAELSDFSFSVSFVLLPLARLASVSGNSTPPTSFITCIIGGSVRAMLESQLAVLLLPLPSGVSQTTTLSNLMFEIAWAEDSTRLSKCSISHLWT